MFIVLEGCDKVGKTTLANKLSKELALPIIKFSQPTGDPFLEYVNFLLTHTEPAILDRFYLGEEVYGPLKRGKSALASWQRRTLEELLAVRGALCVYVTTDATTIARKFKEEKETFVKPAEIKRILTGYQRAIRTSQLDWVRHDYAKPATVKTVEARVNQFALEQAKHESLVRSLITLRTKGSLTAHTLLVGEVVNARAETGEYQHLKLPFMRGHAATGLYDALKSRGYTLGDYAVTNAHKLHLEEGGSLWDELQLPNLDYVVMLGKSATEAVLELRRQLQDDPHAVALFNRLELISAPHPSYARRFNKMAQLRKALP
jgi:thymidylate kinase